MIDHRQLRISILNWFGSLKPSLYATHNFGYRVSPQTGGKSLVRFYNVLQRRVHGRNWNKRVVNQTMIAVGIWEHLDSNPHCHVLISSSADEQAWLLENGNTCWLALQPRGQFDIGKIDSLAKVSRYISKELYRPDSLDQLFLYKAPPTK